MRYNWNAVMNAVTYLTDEPSANGPLIGPDYRVERGREANSIVIVMVRTDEQPEPVPATVEPTPPTPQETVAAAPPLTTIPAEPSEEPKQEPTPIAPPVPMPTPIPSTVTPLEVPTGIPADSGAVATGQGVPATGVPTGS